MIPPDEWERLQAYLDGWLTSPEARDLEERLKADDLLAQSLILLSREQALISRWSHASVAAHPEWLDGVQTNGKVSRRLALPTVSRSRRFRVVAFGLTAAAALLLVVLGALFWKPHTATTPATPQTVVAELNDVVGKVHRSNADGVIPVQAGDAIAWDDEVHTNDDSSAVIRYTDGTTLEVGPGTSVRFSKTEAGGKGVFISVGVVTADVTPQRQAMLVTTPHARIKVLGTRFSSVSGPQATHVELEEGKIELTRRSDGQTIEVQPGSYAVAAPDAKAFESQPLPPQITTEKQELSVGDGPVLAVAFSPDGKSVATGSWKGMVCLWDLAEGEQRLFLPGHRRKVRSLAFTPDGKFLVSSSEDSTVRVWDLEQGKERWAFTERRDLHAVAVSPDGRYLAVGGIRKHPGVIKLWNLTTGNEIGTCHRHDSCVTSLAFSPDGKVLASAGKDATVRLWNLSTFEELALARSPAKAVNAIVFSPDGNQLASADSDGTIQFWDRDLKPLQRLKSRTGSVSSLAFSPHGRILVSSGARGSATLWDLRAEKEGPTIHGHKYSIPHVAISPDGRYLATAGWDRLVKIWDLQTAK